MESWRSTLLQRITEENARVHRAMQAFSRTTEEMMHREPCARCEVKCYDFELIAFPCGHAHCVDCAEDLVERQRGYLEKHHPEYVARYSSAQECLVTCSCCQLPISLTPRTDFQAHIARRGRGTRQRFELNKEATAALMPKMYEYFDNQRRSLLGKFNSESLFLFERPAQSDENGNRLKQKVADIDQLNRSIVILPLLNRGTVGTTDRSLVGIGGVMQMRLVFLDAWSFSKDNTPQGWRYATNWPSNENGWSFAPAWHTFVRRRRMRRPLVHLPRRCLWCHAATMRESGGLVHETAHSMTFWSGAGNIATPAGTPKVGGFGGAATFAVVARRHRPVPLANSEVPEEEAAELRLLAAAISRIVRGAGGKRSGMTVEVREGPRDGFPEDEPHTHILIIASGGSGREVDWGDRIEEVKKELGNLKESYLHRGFAKE